VLPPLEDDPRFAEALAHFASGDWLEASDLFEELFFEAVRDEVPLVRALLQISTGMHHISRGQRRAAVQRLEEGLRAIETVTNARGVDLGGLREQARTAIAQFARNSQEQPD
jgi:predicted metal-dependent hydrolase